MIFAKGTIEVENTSISYFFQIKIIRYRGESEIPLHDRT